MKYCFYILMLLFFACELMAQSNQLSSLHFNFLGVKDGLPEGSVHALLQDKYGYIWIGTQNGLVKYDGYKTKVYNLTSRVSGIDIRKIYEDSRGRLWIGTINNGLCYYDRANDKLINYLPDTKGRDADVVYSISDMIDDNNGNLWLIIYNRVNKHISIRSFSPSTGTFTSYGNTETGNHYIGADKFSTFAKNSSGTIFAGSENGIYQYDAKQDAFLPHLTTTDSSQQKNIYLITKDNRNTDILWLAAGTASNGILQNGALIKYNSKTKTYQSYTHNASSASSIASNSIASIYNDNNGNVWIGTDSGLSVLNTQTEQFTNYASADARPGYRDNEISEIKPDKKGNLWMASNNGLLYFNTITKEFTRHTYDPKSNNGIPGSYVHNLMMDATGILWFGTEQLGLQWLNTSDSKFTLYQSNPKLNHYFYGGAVNSFAEAKDGTYWLSSENGLYHWQPATDSFTYTLLDKRGSQDMYANSVLADRDGLVWCRAYGNNGATKGLYCYDPKNGSIKNYRHNNKDSASLSEDNIRSLYEDHTGIIWIGTFGAGMCSFNKKTQTFTHYPYLINNSAINREAISKHVLDDDQVQSIYEDNQGTLWVGTNNGSINRFDRQTNRFVPYPKPVPGMDCVMDMYNDASGKLWVGTYMNGLFSLDTKQNRYIKYSQDNGLLYNGGWGIRQDKKGNLWLASPRGFTVLTSGGQMRTITAANGLPAEPVAFTLFEGSNGHFFYGTKDGFAEFNPNDFTPDTTLPVVHIESIDFIKQTADKTGDSTTVAFGKNEIALRHDENRITIHYVGLLYQNTSLIQYRYKLDGYDKNWIDAGTQRQVTYTNLSPGMYTFYVTASNSDGVGGRIYDSVVIVISPPWWQTWWAYLLYLLLFGAAVWAFIAYRSQRLQKENKVLEERVTERTQQLNQSLTELKSTQAQLIQSEKMASLGELTAGIAHEIQNPLNFVNNFSEVNREMIVEMKEEIEKGNYEEAKLIAKDIEENEQKITHHGKRADAIVKGMLQHSRKSTGQKEATDINALCDEYLRLSYHGMRTKDKSFNASLQSDFDDAIGKISIVPQDMGRVLLNLFNNAFYAVNEKQKKRNQSLKENEYKPLVSVTTRKVAGGVEISISDNGNGIPQQVVNKVFQPFFTTKPTGEGTGLGLSLSYDIVTKEHGGTLAVESKEGEGAKFVIVLPVR